MSIAYNDLSDDVCGFLQIDSDDRDKFNIDSALNRAQDHLLNILPPRYLVNAIRTWKGNLLLGEGAYQWPADFIRYIKMWIDYDNPITKTNYGYDATLVGDAQLLDYQNLDLRPSQERPKISMGAEGGFEMQPIPDANVTNGWRLRYVAKLVTITTDQPCLLRDNLRNLLTFYATSLAAMTEGYSPALHQEFMAYYREELTMFLPKSLPTVRDQDGLIRNNDGGS